MTWPRSRVVNVSDFGNRGPGSIRGWAPIIPCLFFLHFFNVKMLKYLIQVICDI